MSLSSQLERALEEGNTAVCGRWLPGCADSRQCAELLGQLERYAGQLPELRQALGLSRVI